MQKEKNGRENCMEIRQKNHSGCFTLRAAALILRDGCVLLAKNDRYDCFYTIGGGVCQNESSAEAVLRECREETGCSFEIDRLAFVQERFYTADQVPHHEVTFFYLMKDGGFAFENGMPTDQSGEHLYWIPVEKMENRRVVPAFLCTALKNLPIGTVHILSRE